MALMRWSPARDLLSIRDDMNPAVQQDHGDPMHRKDLVVRLRSEPSLFRPGELEAVERVKRPKICWPLCPHLH